MKIKILIIIVLIYLAISCKTKKNEGVLLPIGESVVSAEQFCDEKYKETDKILESTDFNRREFNEKNQF